MVPIDFVIVVALGGLIISLIYKVVKHHQIKNRAIEEMPDEHEETDMETIYEVDWRGHSMQFTEHERIEWLKLTRKQKNLYVQKQREAIRSGRYVQVKRPGGGVAYITRAEAKEKGLI